METFKRFITVKSNTVDEISFVTAMKALYKMKTGENIPDFASGTVFKSLCPLQIGNYSVHNYVVDDKELYFSSTTNSNLRNIVTESDLISLLHLIEKVVNPNNQHISKSTNEIRDFVKVYLEDGNNVKLIYYNVAEINIKNNTYLLTIEKYELKNDYGWYLEHLISTGTFEYYFKEKEVTLNNDSGFLF